jgi:hypothetical protein
MVLSLIKHLYHNKEFFLIKKYRLNYSRVHAEENKRRTLQRSDIATAVSKTDMCDFLIDIVPREETAKSQPQAFDQPEYASYYAQGGVPSFSASQVIYIYIYIYRSNN